MSSARSTSARPSPSPSSRCPASRAPPSSASESNARLGAKPLPACGPDPGDVVVVHETHSSADHPQKAAGDEDPGFGLGIAVRVEEAFGLAAADDVGDVLVHLAHVA